MDIRTLSDQGIRCKNELLSGNEQAQFERIYEITRSRDQTTAFFDDLARDQWKKPARLGASCCPGYLWALESGVYLFFVSLQIILIAVENRAPVARQTRLVHGFTYLFLARTGGLGSFYMVINAILTGDLG
jgi:hypothetical protein